MAITQDAWFVDTYAKVMRQTTTIDVGSTTPGLFKGALFTGSVVPDFNQTNPAYGSSPLNSGESSGPGYTAGGQDLTVASFGTLTATNKVGWRFATVTWEATTLSAEGLLIYAPGLSNKAFVLRSFDGVKTTADGTFEISFDSEGGAWRVVLRNTA
ncbi:hypothetical protein FXF51_06180 [Nonomuraea sp. PA05]|uniref:hypothetical protein n=1 Tax=Nonomuraea sp. PA05 TaxID=2604466 RepID=UPI0011DA9EEE|nr:hypothetical protein [Nonomuraea sp. PA05]TYB69748.1 hypothetical protein FXF51_06180 [Nonomuraea sp. PA05]